MNKYKVVSSINRESRISFYKIVQTLDGRAICSHMNEKTANYICKLINDDADKKGISYGIKDKK